MIPQVTSTPVQMGGLSNDVHEATISGSVQIFDMFIDSTYPNKALAATREPIQNALDAHIMAGIKDTPIEVHLPTMMTPELIIRDFGIGMSEAGIRMGMCLGGTDKNTNNDVHGGKGIGFMAAYAYTDGFTIETVHDGMKSTYRMFRKEEDRMPAMIQIGTTKRSNEPSGTSVRIAVNPDDYSKFSKSLHDVANRFFVKPTVTGDPSFKFDEVVYIIEGKGWGIRPEDANRNSYSYRYEHRPLAIMGNLSYPIEYDVLRDSGAKGDHFHILKCNLDIEFNIGDLEVATSREGLSYNTQTVDALGAKLLTIYTELKQEVNNKLVGCATAWEANRVLHETLQTVQHLEVLKGKGVDFLHNGKVLPNRFRVSSIDTDDKVKAKLNFFGIDNSYSMSGMRKHETPVIIAANHTPRGWGRGTLEPYNFVIIHDKQQRVPSRLQAWRDNGLTTKANTTMIILCDDKDDPVHNKKVVMGIIAELGNPPYTDMADIDDVSVSQGTSTGQRSTVAKVTRFTGDGRYNTYDKDAWNACDVDIDNNTGYYVDLRAWHPVSMGNNEGLRRNIDLAVTASIIPEDTIIYGIPGTHKNMMKASPNWMEFKDFLAQETVKALYNAHVERMNINRAEGLYAANRQSGDLLALISANGRLNPKSLMFKEAADYTMFTEAKLNLRSATAVLRLCDFLQSKGTKYDDLWEMKEGLREDSTVRDALYTAYPLLRVIKIGSEWDDGTINEMVTYINSKGEV